MSPGQGNIRLVSFDVGGTLIHPNPTVGTVYAEVLTRRGFACRSGEVDEAFEESWEAAAARQDPGAERYRGQLLGERGYWRDLLTDTVKRLGGSQPPSGAAEELFERFARAETWRIYPDVLPILEDLARRGIAMAIVSNWDSRLPRLLRELGLRRFFGPMVVSALEEIEKPDPRMFHLAARRAGVSTREVLHVGDRDREDRLGALRAGCLALRIDRDAEGGIGLAEVLPLLGDGARSGNGGENEA